MPRPRKHRDIQPYKIQHLRDLSSKERVMLFSDPVTIEEKIDGYSLYMLKDADGEIHVSTKGRDGILEHNGYFGDYMEQINSVIEKITPEVVYRMELVTCKRMVELEYNRAAEGGMILWSAYDQTVYQYTDKLLQVSSLASSLGIEPVYRHGVYDLSDMGPHQRMGLFRDISEIPSQLGGKSEGIVIKNYHRHDKQGLPLRAKVRFALDS